MVDTSYCFKKNEQIIYKDLADGPVLIDPYRRTLIRLNSMALEIWRLLDGEHSVAGIVEILKDRFDAGELDLKKDVTDFLSELVKREIII